GRGPALFPFTGHGGKNGGSAAGAGLIAAMRRSFDGAGVPLQFGELGKVDAGGGGTIAKYLAERGMDVVDVGICVVGMHSPMELSAVEDVWSAYRGFKHWLSEP
ncbi:MAG TPA: aminopeptidase, partial [Kofleriaceae bacterium]|nr:aminopeptidase [Kofleriaceae bacterium]